MVYQQSKQSKWRIIWIQLLWNSGGARMSRFCNNEDAFQLGVFP